MSDFREARALDDQVFMDAEIRPHRSLSEKGFIILISVVTVVNCICAAVFLAMGAFLVPFFLGLDVLAVLVAFLVSYAAARQVERVVVTDRSVRITHETEKAVRLVWESPTAFTRVNLYADEDQLQDLRVALSGKEAQVARALGPTERARFADALEGAIHRARRTRYVVQE